MSKMFRPPQGPCFRDLQGKVALVTGGGAGIGRGITHRLAAEGMQVFLCGRTEETLETTAQDIRDNGGRAIPVVADVSREDQVAGLFDRIREESGALDLLVHNAALVSGKALAETDAAFWQDTFAANTHSAFYLAKQCAKMMIPRGSGCLIFISTIGSVRAHQGMVAYDSSKAALNSLTRSLALELAGHNIRVNAVAPGAMIGKQNRRAARTQRNAVALGPEIPAELLEQPYVPLGRCGTPAELGAVVAFLASDQSSYITGQILCMDGGATVQISPRGIWI
jgi:NAD(P)-dependent dehydrogenase (short-subunit alcohol dehydrogenase family)